MLVTLPTSLARFPATSLLKSACCIRPCSPSTLIQQLYAQQVPWMDQSTGVCLTWNVTTAAMCKRRPCLYQSCL
jgi:hypothetical protein